MNAVLIIGGILIFILLFALLTTLIGEIATTKCYKKRLEEYNLSLKMLKEIQSNDILNRGVTNKKNSEKRENMYSAGV